MAITKPSLAANIDSISQLRYPLLISEKLDGIRCLRIDGKTLSRSFKPIPNKFIQEQMKDLPSGLDGELMVVDAEFNGVQSGVMSIDGEPNFVYAIFDYVKDNLARPYTDRIKDLIELGAILPSFCKLILPTQVNNEQELLAYEATALVAGHEGVMVRTPSSPYKCGRSTVKESYLIKVKRFKDSEAEIVGFIERMHNANEAEVDELGHTKRSSAKDGMIPAGTLGTLLVRDIYNDVRFGIGTGKGLNDALKQEIWDNRNEYLGKVVNYRFQEVGTLNAPRIPSFQSFRDKRDI